MKKSLLTVFLVTLIFGGFAFGWAILGRADTRQNDFQEIWTRSFGPYSGYSVIQTIDRGYAIGAANSSSHRGGYSDDFPLLIKTDSEGSLQWARTYQGVSGVFKMITYLIQTQDGGFLLSGPGASSVGSYTWLMKTDALGNIKWNMSFPFPSPLASTPAILTGNNSIFVFGENGWIANMDLSGRVLWNKTIATSIGIGQVVWASDGNFVLAGAINNSHGGSNGLLLKTDVNGTLIWLKTFGPDNSDSRIGNGLLLEVSDGYVSAASWNGNFWTFKTDSDGNLVFNETFGPVPAMGSQGFSNMAQTNDGGVLLTGGGGAYSWLLKLDPVGNVLWSKNFTLQDSVWGFRTMLPLANGGCVLTTPSTIARIDMFGNLVQNQTFSERFHSSLLVDSGFVLVGQTLDLSTWIAKFNIEMDNASASPSLSPQPGFSPTPSPSVPEFPNWIIIPLMAAAATTIVYPRRRGKR